MVKILKKPRSMYARLITSSLFLFNSFTYSQTAYSQTASESTPQAAPEATTSSTIPVEAVPTNSAKEASPTSSVSSPSSKIAVEFHFFEKGTGQIVKRVEVKLGNLTEYADKQGVLKVELPSVSTQQVMISRTGFETVLMPLADVVTKPFQEIYLIPSVPEDNLIFVRGEKKTAVSRKILKVEEAAKIAPGGDPAQVIKLMPGVQTQAFNPQVIVRGSGPTDSKYYVDSIEVPYIFHFVGGLSLLPASLLSEVQFDSGGFGAEYGNATGGIIVLKTKNEIPERAITRFIFNTPLYSGVSYETPLSEDSSFFASYRRSYIDFFIQAVIEQQAKKTGKPAGITIAPFFSDGHLVYLKKRDNGYSKITFIASEEGIKAIVPAKSSTSEDGTSSLYTNVQFATLAYEYYYRINREWVLRTTPQYYSATQTSDFFGNKVEVSVLSMRVPTEMTKKIGKKEYINFGIDPNYKIAKIDIFSILPNFEDPTFDPEDASKVKVVQEPKGYNIASWVSVRKIYGDLKITPGVRVTYDGEVDREVVDPRFIGQYDLTKKHSLKMAVGQYSKSPEYGEAEIAKSTSGRRLNFERSKHYVLGVHTNWNDYWQSEIQVFSKTTTGSVRPDPIYSYNNAGSSRAKGLELFLRRNLTNKVFGWISYTYSQTEERDSDDDPFKLSQYDQPHVLNFAGNYKITGTWDLGARYSFASGEVYTPVNKSVYNSYLDKYQPRREEEDVFSKRLSNSNSITIYANHDFLYNTWKMAMKFGVETLYLESPVLGISHNFDYSNEEPRVGPPVIPFFELRGEF